MKNIDWLQSYNHKHGHPRHLSLYRRRRRVKIDLLYIVYYYEIEKLLCRATVAQLSRNCCKHNKCMRDCRRRHANVKKSDHKNQCHDKQTVSENERFHAVSSRAMEEEKEEEKEEKEKD